MSAAARLGYALTRMHAHLADRPQATDWQRLSGSESRADCLSLARRLGLRHWLRNVADEAPVDRLESRLRGNLRDHIAMVSAWMPAEWRPATAWTGLLAELPAIDHLQRDGIPPAWMREDPLFGPLATGIEKLPRTHTVGPLFADSTEDAVQRWQRHWVSLWPPGHGARALQRCSSLLARLADAGRPPTLPLELERLIRREPLHVTALFAYVGLAIDDQRRLTGELARRSPAWSH